MPLVWREPSATSYAAAIKWISGLSVKRSNGMSTGRIGISTCYIVTPYGFGSKGLSETTSSVVVNKAMQLKARIRNLALANNIPAQAVLQNYMLERLLERIACSKYKDKFILKGGMLIASLVGIESRTTMDMDAAVQGFPLSEKTLQDASSEICAIYFFSGRFFRSLTTQLVPWCSG